MPKSAADLDDLYQSLRALLVGYERPRPGYVLESRSATDHDFDLWSVRDLVIDGRARKEVYFAGIRLQKSFVGFYYFPIYSVPRLGESLGPALLKLLKGKSCFRVKTLQGGIGDQIRSALELGLDKYRERGWL